MSWRAISTRSRAAAPGWPRSWIRERARATTTPSFGWSCGRARCAELAATRAELDERWRATIGAVVRYGQERGEFGPADPDEFAVLLASLLDGLSVQIALGDSKVTGERVRELALRLAERELGCDMEVTKC